MPGSEVAALAHCFEGGENLLINVFGDAAVFFARVRVIFQAITIARHHQRPTCSCFLFLATDLCVGRSQ